MDHGWILNWLYTKCFVLNVYSNMMSLICFSHGHRRRWAVSFRLCLTEEEGWGRITLSEPEPVTGPWVYTEAVYLFSHPSSKIQIWRKNTSKIQVLYSKYPYIPVELIRIHWQNCPPCLLLGSSLYIAITCSVVYSIHICTCTGAYRTLYRCTSGNATTTTMEGYPSTSVRPPAQEWPKDTYRIHTADHMHKASVQTAG